MLLIGYSINSLLKVPNSSKHRNSFSVSCIYPLFRFFYWSSFDTFIHYWSLIIFLSKILITHLYIFLFSLQAPQPLVPGWKDISNKPIFCLSKIQSVKTTIFISSNKKWKVCKKCNLFINLGHLQKNCGLRGEILIARKPKCTNRDKQHSFEKEDILRLSSTSKLKIN